MPPSPYLTGDMPSSAAAVNAIVGGPGREAVVAGSVPSHILKTPLGRGEKRPGVVDAPPHHSLFSPGQAELLPFRLATFQSDAPKIYLT